MFYEHFKILTLCRTSDPNFGLFEMSEFRYGDRTCFEVRHFIEESFPMTYEGPDFGH